MQVKVGDRFRVNLPYNGRWNKTVVEVISTYYDWEDEKMFKLKVITPNKQHPHLKGETGYIFTDAFGEGFLTPYIAPLKNLKKRIGK